MVDSSNWAVQNLFAFTQGLVNKLTPFLGHTHESDSIEMLDIGWATHVELLHGNDG